MVSTGMGNSSEENVISTATGAFLPEKSAPISRIEAMAALAMKQLLPEVPKLSPECKQNMSKIKSKEYNRKRFEQAKLAKCVKRYEEVWEEVVSREKARMEEAKMAKTISSSTTDTTDTSGSARSRSRSPAESDVRDDDSEVFEFVVQYPTKFGEELYVIGSCPELGDWDLGKKVHMGWFEGNHWKVKVAIPKERQAIEYKFVVGHYGNDRWEAGFNHRFEAAAVEGLQRWRLLVWMKPT